MKKTRISDGWYFRYTGEEQNEYRKVDLPHDMTVGLPRRPDSDGGAGNGFWPSADGVYWRYLTPGDDACVILDVDGAYMCAEVTVNEKFHLSTHPHGYTPYLTELTEALRPGRVNKISVSVHALQPSARWYSGGGLYRDVFLWTGGPVRIEPRDLFVTTLSADGEAASLRVSGEITSDLDAEARVVLTVTDGEGETVVSGICQLAAEAGERTAFETTLAVPSPRLWDMDDPYLYTLRAEVFADGAPTDTAEILFGIRTISFDTEHGFRLNGRERKLRGGCIHHDHGVLGAAAYPAAEERKVRLLKAAGFNALRIAHNPPSLALLEVCDRLGILVVDEAFDMWNIRKRPLDYHLWFEDWWDTDIACMVSRDRNHPCVIAYSIGNEIHERDGRSNGYELAAMLADEVRRYDDTRPVTSALCGMWNSSDVTDPEEYVRDCNFGMLKDPGDGSLGSNWPERTEAFYAPLDLAGYNYSYLRYEADHARYPDRVMWGSETHAIHFWDSWHEVARLPWVIGDFTWTAYDNLGEAGTGRWAWARDGVITGISLGPWPWRSCYQGDLDLCGYRRPQSYYRETVWGLRSDPVMFTTHPEHTGEGFTGTEWHWYDVHDTWTFEDRYVGKPVKVDVYTDAEETEFLLNGRSLGRAPVERDIATMEIPYEPGTLTAVCYRDGKETGRVSLETVGEETSLVLAPEREAFRADGRDLLYVRICAEDGAGRRVTECRREIRCSVEGGRLLGVFSGDPKNEDVYGSDTCHLFEGRALAVISADAPGTVRVRVMSEGLNGAEAKADAE